jgi:hypothetical protein
VLAPLFVVACKWVRADGPFDSIALVQETLGSFDLICDWLRLLSLTAASFARGAGTRAWVQTVALVPIGLLACRYPEGLGWWWSAHIFVLMPLAALAGMWLGDLAWERLAARLDRPSP